MNAKEYLSQVMFIDRRIDSKLEQVMTLRDMAAKASALVSDMPRADSPNLHSMEDTIIRIVDLEREINRDIDRLVDLKAEVRRAISQVEEPEQQLVLELRYLCYKKWSEIMIELNYSEPTVYRLHDEALKKIAVPDQ